MATISITGTGLTVQPAHPKMLIRSAAGARLVVPLAPAGAEFGGYARRWVDQDRPNRKPLSTDTGPSLATENITLVIARSDGSPITDLLKALRDLAQTKDCILYLQNLSELEEGPWTIRNLAIRGVTRAHGTNDWTVAEADLSLVEYVKPATTKLRKAPAKSKGKK